MSKRKPLEYKIAHRHVRLRSGVDGTTWPWPFAADADDDDDNDSAAHRARYAPHTLTKDDAMELAEIADAYAMMIMHPCRSVAERIFDLRRVYKEQL